ncbi:NAD(P)H-hydrate dehydratase [Shouchella clausii]|uniref:NAD(P)H-hydrate dehydratase n=1 Tax=Shouchella clausii TaxID=79880 RepID=UPI00280A5CB5|nr:NAD(P)H-hydrate dehydratase [Shouchella clausii]WMM33386.1 NAD(P)H-hydrate dehydratase [Shouchella clausii]
MRIVTGEEMASIDAITMNKVGLPGAVLMENAGRGIARKLLDHYGRKRRFFIVIGSGNNGGDGFVVARVLKDEGAEVQVFIVPEESRYKGDAKLHKRVFEQSGYRWKYWKDIESQWPAMLYETDIIVDALLGTGISGQVKEPYASVIASINKLKNEIVSIDLPSGVPAGSAELNHEAIKADRTLTLQWTKVSYYLEETKPYYGEVDVVPIGIPPNTLRHLASQRYIWGKNEVVNSWVMSKPNAHKGDNGRVGIIAGSEAMPGAAALAGSAAVRSGAGFTTIATVAQNVPVIASHVKEAMYTIFSEKHGYLAPTEAELAAFMDNKQSIAVGPGLGRTPALTKMVAYLLVHFKGVLILDADALHCLKECGPIVQERTAPTVITPHPGEMAMLIDQSVSYVNKNRFEVAESYAEQYGVYVVLKGPNTIVAEPSGCISVNVTGNAGLAKGGSGDVLTGMVAALVARQRIQPALSSAVFFHGYAADLLAKQRQVLATITPSDIIEHLPEAFSIVDDD